MGIWNSPKILKLFEYLKNNFKWNGFVFPEKKHSSAKDEKTWLDNFKDNLFFYHGKTSSYGVAIGYLEQKQY